jgi:L-iditol 2-dehydrogenase
MSDQANRLMRAARLHGIHDIRLEQLPRPSPGRDQVLLRVACVGICGSDVHYYLEGRIGGQVISEPLVLGHEFSAWVEALGADVAGLRLGQLVAVEPAVSCGICEQCEHGHPNLCPNVRFCGCPPFDGVLAEYALMPAENLFPLPDTVGPLEGALLEPLGVAIHAVDLAHMKPGQTVSVLGAGPIGLMIAAVARAAGASEVYMTEPLADRRQFALEYVADAVFHPGDGDPVARILELTGGRGVDVAFEAAGAEKTPQQCADVVRFGGKVIIAGIPGDDSMTMTASVVRRKGLTIKLVRRMKHTYPRAIRMVASGMVDIAPLARPVLPLEQVAEAFQATSSYRAGVLRAVIRVSD